MNRRSIVKHVMPWNTLPICKSIHLVFFLFQFKEVENEHFYHFDRPDDLTIGVSPNLNKFLFLLIFTMLNMTLFKKKDIKIAINVSS